MALTARIGHTYYYVGRPSGLSLLSRDQAQRLELTATY